jgi:hypothetical protein
MNRLTSGTRRGILALVGAAALLATAGASYATAARDQLAHTPSGATADAKPDLVTAAATCRTGCRYRVTLNVASRSAAGSGGGRRVQTSRIVVSATTRLRTEGVEGNFLAYFGVANGTFAVTLSQSDASIPCEWTRTFRTRDRVQVTADVALNGSRPPSNLLGASARLQVTTPGAGPSGEPGCGGGEIGRETQWSNDCSFYPPPAYRCTREALPGLRMQGGGYSVDIDLRTRGRQTLRRLSFPFNRLWAGRTFSLAGSRRIEHPGSDREDESRFSIVFTRVP